MTQYKVGRYLVNLTHEDKVLFTQPTITKSDLIEYYESIADIMIPHIKNRPLSLYRCVEGIAQDCFYQKNAADYFPSWIKTVPVKKEEGGTVDYVLCNNAATLVYLANQVMITPHVWLSRVPALTKPDRMIFDLDPVKQDFKTLCGIAHELRALLEECGLHPHVMTTGSRGLHVVTPLKPSATFDDVRSFAYQVGQIMVDRHPDLLTLELRKNKRHGRVFVDVLRNSWTATGVAPYGVRAIAGAPVAMPLRWEDLKKRGLMSQTYTIKNMMKYIEKYGDAWADIASHARPLGGANKKLKSLAQNS